MVTLENGKRKVLCGRTRQEVAKKLTAALSDRERGVPSSVRGLTVGRLLDRWLEARKPTVEPLTFESYAEIVRLHLQPELGKLSAAKLTPQQVDKLLAGKLKSGLSPRRVQYIRAVLRMALTQVEKWGELARNVAKLSLSPKVLAPAVRRKSADDTLALLAAVNGDRLTTLCTLVATTGLR